MSTKGSTYWDDPTDTTGWTVQPKQWCPECCCAGCGCPTAERIIDEHHIVRGTE